MCPLSEIKLFQLAFVLIVILATNGVFCAPTDTSINNNDNNKQESTSYDFSQFQEVYDQRQNGSENYRIDLNDVVLVWTPLASLIPAANLLADPGLFEGEYPDLEEFFKPDNSEKPQDLFIVKPESTSTSTSTTTTTTVKPIEIEINADSNLIQKPANIPSQQETGRRKLRLPGFIRPFIRRPSK